MDKRKGQGLVEYVLVVLLIAVVLITLLGLVGGWLESEQGRVVCPDETYVGEVYTGSDDVYVITTETGREVRAPKDLCIFEER